ncbi:hypothetical protein E2C05_25805, partial [Paracraurococcus ruber]
MRHPGRQGRVWAAFAVAALLAGCAVPDEVNPVKIYNRVSGNDDALRPEPPGMDRPTPNLATIPPRPERPPPAFRQAVTESLAGDRAASRDPLVLRSIPAPGQGPRTGAPAETGMPAAPPAPPRLAGA